MVCSIVTFYEIFLVIYSKDLPNIYIFEFIFSTIPTFSLLANFLKYIHIFQDPDLLPLLVLLVTALCSISFIILGQVSWQLW